MIDVVRRSARPLDAVIGWVDSPGRSADVARAKHPIADRLAERVPRARVDGTVRAAVHTARRDES